MIVDSICTYVQEQDTEIEEETKPIDPVLQPGSAYLKLMEYYREEKELNQLPNKTETWEKFIAKYFSQNVEMSIKVFQEAGMFSEISKYNTLLFKLQLSTTFLTFISIRTKVY